MWWPNEVMMTSSTGDVANKGRGFKSTVDDLRMDGQDEAVEEATPREWRWTCARGLAG
jgi:hypothetical protein